MISKIVFPYIVVLFVRIVHSQYEIMKMSEIRSLNLDKSALTAGNYIYQIEFIRINNLVSFFK